MPTSQELIRVYLQDAIAAEKSFETQLTGFSGEGEDPAVKQLFEQHAEETKRQHERLTARLHALGGETSTFKSMLAHLFSMAPKSASLGHEKEERTTQNLMIAYAVENSEVAMYEALAASAAAAGDTTTEMLAREIQAEEQRTAEKVWAHIAPTAQRAIYALAADAK